jgi:predicted PurR-regulated permease PerM
MKNKKGTIALYFVFIVLSIVIVIITALVAPMGILINTEFYKAGEQILNNSQDSLNGIQDDEIRNAINGTINAAKDNTINNIEVSGALYQYSWVLLIIITALVLFLFTRRLTESGYGGFL